MNSKEANFKVFLKNSKRELVQTFYFDALDQAIQFQEFSNKTMKCLGVELYYTYPIKSVEYSISEEE